MSLKLYLWLSGVLVLKVWESKLFWTAVVVVGGSTNLKGSCNTARQGMCFGVCFASVLWGHASKGGKMNYREQTVLSYRTRLLGFRW